MLHAVRHASCVHSLQRFDVMAARVNRDEQHVLVNLDGWTNTPLIHEASTVAG